MDTYPSSPIITPEVAQAVGNLQDAIRDPQPGRVSLYRDRLYRACERAVEEYETRVEITEAGLAALEEQPEAWAPPKDSRYH